MVFVFDGISDADCFGEAQEVYEDGGGGVRLFIGDEDGEEVDASVLYISTHM